MSLDDKSMAPPGETPEGWIADIIHCAVRSAGTAGVRKRAGMRKAGIGIYLVGERRPARLHFLTGEPASSYCVVHRYSGHAICEIDANSMAEACQKAEAILAICHFEFTGLTGWRNINPNLPADLEQLLKAGIVRRPKSNLPHDETAAREVLKETE